MRMIGTILLSFVIVLPISHTTSIITAQTPACMPRKTFFTISLPANAVYPTDITDNSINGGITVPRIATNAPVIPER